MVTQVESHWWARDHLGYRDGRLAFCGRDVAQTAATFAEPLFMYDAQRPIEKLRSIERALNRHAVRHRLFYAMKANRFAPLLCALRADGRYGVDACSPEELREALACGFAPSQISYTSHGMAPDEAALLAALPEVLVNCDTLAAVRMMGAYGTRREIGLRINPGLGIGYGNNERLLYAGRTTKFGIYREQFDEAIALARESGLAVTRLHCHAGCGYLDAQLRAFEAVLDAVCDFADALPGIREINLGGGLGVPHRAADKPLDLDAWAAVIALRTRRLGVTIAVEPGDFVVKDAGLLVLQVNYIEKKRDVVFAGLSGGFNLAVEPAFYDLPCEAAPCVLRDGEPSRVTLAGNINEALDLWASDVMLPPLTTGDYVALLNAGGYAASMSSNHCMRGRFREMLLC
ncbi:diaminopimelate decarboxylase [Paraburkholderia sp. Tr-20389]|uniref:diaminopimelate decarboxylase n=1 Tax=Paraburkholderia sp. Tr-20389 TaxID=2703903 RepID=UPI001F11EFA2|nr:diaminopimelate decarboxylase [Paraburkholderia sp. Tr-20389]